MQFSIFTWELQAMKQELKELIIVSNQKTFHCSQYHAFVQVL